MITSYDSERYLNLHQIPDTHRNIIDDSQTVILATNGGSGRPQVTASWFLWDEDTLKLSLNTSRQKVKNLQKDPALTAFFMDPASPYRTLELRGQVSIDEDPDLAFADRVGAKYGSDLRKMDEPGETRVVVTLNIEKVNYFG
jgi:PPOX class probable F420-dependent enzyme